MSKYSLFHTAEIHTQTFDALSPEAELTHVVRPDWLQRAQGGIDLKLRAEIQKAIQAEQDPVLCSCTTIGEVAEEAGAVRIDWPMMQEAARLGGPVLLAYCLSSTAAPSEALLRRAFGKEDPEVNHLHLNQHWSLFAAGDTEGFAATLAGSIQEAVQEGGYACVVLAQASMAGAAEKLRDICKVPVLASPALAAKYMAQKTG